MLVYFVKFSYYITAKMTFTRNCCTAVKTLRALSYTQCNAKPGATQVFPACCLNSKCTRAHLFAHGRLKTRGVQAYCWCVAILRPLKTTAPLTNRNLVQSQWHSIYLFFCFLKGALVICIYMRVHNAHTSVPVKFQ